jgi:hypothetical protein
MISAAEVTTRAACATPFCTEAAYSVDQVGGPGIVRAGLGHDLEQCDTVFADRRQHCGDSRFGLHPGDESADGVRAGSAGYVGDDEIVEFGRR